MIGPGVAITGASGFIGTHLLKAMDAAARPISIRDPEWPKALASRKPFAIVHLAGIPQDRCSDEEIQMVNVGGTQALAIEAIRHGVRRFVFVSTIQALAESSNDQGAINNQVSALPRGTYGKSKLEAEQILCRLCTESQMELVIIRSPLVYGPGVKANFRKLLHLVDKGIPLPLSALDSNRRSFVGVSNLIDLILLCLMHPAAANQTFHVSDGDDVSTAELLRRMGKALGKPVRNVPIPKPVLKTGLRIIERGDWVDKLCGDLRVDISETKRLLGWKPKVTMEEELERTAKWWRSRER